MLEGASVSDPWWSAKKLGASSKPVANSFVTIETILKVCVVSQKPLHVTNYSAGCVDTAT